MTSSFGRESSEPCSVCDDASMSAALASSMPRALPPRACTDRGQPCCPACTHKHHMEVGIFYGLLYKVYIGKEKHNREVLTQFDRFRFVYDAWWLSFQNKRKRNPIGTSCIWIRIPIQVCFSRKYLGFFIFIWEINTERNKKRKTTVKLDNRHLRKHVRWEKRKKDNHADV